MTYSLLRLHDDDVWRVANIYDNAADAASAFIRCTGRDIARDWIVPDLRAGCSFERESDLGDTYVVTGAPIEPGAVFDGRRVA